MGFMTFDFYMTPLHFATLQNWRFKIGGIGYHLFRELLKARLNFMPDVGKKFKIYFFQELRVF